MVFGLVFLLIAMLAHRINWLANTIIINKNRTNWNRKFTKRIEEKYWDEVYKIYIKDIYDGKYELIWPYDKFIYKQKDELIEKIQWEWYKNKNKNDYTVNIEDIDLLDILNL